MPEIWTLLAALTKLGLYLGALNAVGRALVGVVFGPDLSLSALRRGALAWIGVAVFCAVASFGLRAAELTGALSGLWDAEMLSLLWGTAAGDALTWRLAGLAVMAVGLIFVSGWGPWVALAGGAMAMLSFARVGHVADLDVPWITALLWLHLVAAAFWIGILAPLIWLTVTPGDSAPAVRVGERFGRIAAVALPVLGVAGVVMAWWLVGSFDGLLTGYGLWLMLKLAAVLAFLWLGAANKLRHVPALAAGAPGADMALRRSLRLEQGVALLVLAATAALTSFVALPG